MVDGKGARAAGPYTEEARKGGQLEGRDAIGVWLNDDCDGESIVTEMNASDFVIGVRMRRDWCIESEWSC